MTIRRRFSLRLTLGTANFMLAVLFAAGCAILFVGSNIPEYTNEASSNPMFNTAAFIGGASILAALFAILSKADRRCADDYAYQLLTSGAYVGMLTMIVANVVWGLPVLQQSMGLRDLRGQDMLAIGMIGWAVGYLAFRIRGLR